MSWSAGESEVSGLAVVATAADPATTPVAAAAAAGGPTQGETGDEFGLGFAGVIGRFVSGIGRAFTS